ncbi:AAA family ATPase [Streptomyces sp. NBC_00250]|uniref:AAA family ATPase n=1 Tax=Streptomyces sp. NBC_00250 TaxID=2903641 RepID=UPI002E2A739A|nr:AAA family ATPase [Streptomyces sp. NBC_00250]
MITQIRIDGFKSFRRFSLDVPPTLIMLGANGAGKSNLFDALRLVAGTADRGFEETVRSDPRLTPARFFRAGRGESVRERGCSRRFPRTGGGATTPSGR